MWYYFRVLDMHINLLIIFLYVTKNGNNYMSQPRYFSGKHPISFHTNADKANHLPCADLTWEAAARSAWRRTMGLQHQAVFGGRQGTMTRTPKMCTKSKFTLRFTRKAPSHHQCKVQLLGEQSQRKYHPLFLQHEKACCEYKSTTSLW